MVRRSLIALLLLAMTATPSLAKGPSVASVCGASQCHTVRGERAVSALFVWQDGPFAVPDTPVPAPYYSIRIGKPSGAHWAVLYVPARHAIRVWQSRVPPYQEAIGPYWRILSPSAEAVLRHAVGMLAPRAAPRRWPA